MKFASENAAEFGAGWGYGDILLEWPLAPGDNIRGAWWRGGGTTVAPRTTFTRSGNLLHQRIGIFVFKSRSSSSNRQLQVPQVAMPSEVMAFGQQTHRRRLQASECTAPIF